MRPEDDTAVIASELAMDEAPANGRVWRCECEVCTTAVASQAAYFAMAFGDPRHLAAASEDLADTLGFCERHGAGLMSNEPSLRAAARVLEGVVPRLLPLLLEQRFGDEKFQQVYFSAHRACPACAYERRAVGRHAARLARRHVEAGELRKAPAAEMLCIQHFQALARGLKPELRMAALTRFAEALEITARALDRLSPATASHQAAPSERMALDHALSMAAGSPARATPAPEAPLAEAIQACPDFEQALGCANACPMCLEVERARQRWLAAVPLAAAHNLDGWLFFPTCPEHVSTVAKLGDAALTNAVCAHALHVGTEHLHQQLRVLARAAETEAELAAARIARWGRRPRRRKSDPPRPAPPRLVRCAACERLAIAELQATGKLLRLLRGEQHRQAFQGGYGLCMKHHAQAYLLSPKGTVRSLLAEDQRLRLSELLCWLEDETRTLARERPVAAPEREYRLAVRRFCGFG